ncbi:HNH endonuclease [Polynucleobacter sp. JS-Polo-80-F4]|uniref:HNH endonuclease n=1 Tax=Polynucleobacter sp. JS-Polo-80-F4 TaxID=2576918 RepID=UPI001C0CD42C|nr:HNH endonuclease signature motif containing protein [Polynucleobacter sp. JS-Polo-80-F4]MBU3615878.1 HNH endonuclease [Polynucleobacter sp. JS-Polo-80-F4]
MIGKIRQKLIELDQPVSKPAKALICPICDRVIPNSQKDAHHLIPKSKGGKTTEYLHRICHKQIHALFTETELAQKYHDAQLLREHSEMKKFIQWVSSKPDAFYEKTRKSALLRSGK